MRSWLLRQTVEDMPATCPSCTSESLIQGRLSLSGTDDGWVTRFYPKGLRFFTLRKAVTLSNGQLFQACLSCGHVWSQASPEEMRELLAASGNEETLRTLTRIQSDAKQR